MTDGIFDLDQKGKRQLDEQAQTGLLDPNKLPPSKWSGFGQAAKGAQLPAAQAARTLMMAAAVAPITWDALNGLVDGTNNHTARDWWFKHAVDNIGQDSVDYWTPDAAQMGSSSRTMSTVFNIAGSVPQMFGTPELFLANSAFSPSTDLVRRNVDARTALAVGGVSLSINAAGFKLPATFGSNLVTRVTAGTGLNLALGAASDAATAQMLDMGGYKDLATQYDWGDMQARGFDAAMGALFGLHGHLEANAQDRALKRMESMTGNSQGEMRDALMTRMTGDHFTSSAMLGEPTSIGAVSRGQKALSQAISDILHGHDVNVADMIHPGDFLPKQSPSMNGYEAYRRALESGGDINARNPNSTALGPDQFTERTWLDTVKKVDPAWADGLTREQLLAARTDPAKSAQIAAALDAENAAALRDAGQPVDRHTLYAAHHFGAERAVAFSEASGDTPMSKILTRKQMDANPYLKGKTKDQVIANWDARAEKELPSEAQTAADQRQPLNGVEAQAIDESALTPEERALVDRARENSRVADATNELTQQLRDESIQQGEKFAKDNGLRDAVETLLPKSDKSPKVVFVHDAFGLPDQLRKTLEARDRARGTDMSRRGTYSPGDNTVYLFTDKVQTPTDAAWTAIHEIGGHYGLRGVVKHFSDVRIGDKSAPDALRETMESALKNETVSKLADAIGKERKSGDRHLMAEEALAELQSAVRTGNWDNIKTRHGVDVPESFRASVNTALTKVRDRIKEIFRAIFGDKVAAFSDQQVMDLLEGAWQHARNPEAVATGDTPSYAKNLSQPSFGDPFMETTTPKSASVEPKATEQDVLTAVQAALKDRPDLAVTLDDGTVVSASEALTQADSFIAQAKVDAKAFAAAAACAMRYP